MADEESTNLMSPAMRKDKQKPDWGRFGLSSEQQKETESQKYSDAEEGYGEQAEQNELFREDQGAQSKPWYKANFFISEPVLFGTWDGVFTSCMINIFGVVIFLRTGWMVGNAGIGYSVLIILMTISVALISVLSAIGVCERCHMQSGGVFFLLSHVLGSQIGASVGVLYCFGQAVACSLYTVGFGESIASLISSDNEWVAKGIAIGVVLLLLGINVAGVQWVIRLQLVLLMVLLVAVLDFAVGSFVHTDIVHGVLGYTATNIKNNTIPDYRPGESFFTVFGVFFPTATGVFAGINMSGDLRNPSKNIPNGTMAAVGVSTLLYLIFTVVLGATCARDVLQTDYMIAEKVAVVGFLWLAGLYISSVSSCMGALYGSPRILQSIANENAIPVIKLLGHGRGPNKVPVFALIVITVITLIFILIGDVNTLGPIVTMPFMLTYAFVDYAYFALAMSFDQQKAREERYRTSMAHWKQGKLDSENNYQTGTNYGATDPAQDLPQRKKSLPTDLDNLFPERLNYTERYQLQRQQSLPSSPTETKSLDSAKGFDRISIESKDTMTEGQKKDGGDTPGDTDELLEKKKKDTAKPNQEISKMPRTWYSFFCNRWLSLLGVLVSLVIMFGIQWAYALANICAFLVVYVYIGQASPGVFPGISDFNFYLWVKDGILRCCRKGPPPQEHIIVTPNTPAMNMMAAQLTEDNDDFAERGRYHQSEVVKGENFDDYGDSD